VPHIVACIDGSVYSESVADHAAWAGVGLGASVELLQVLGRREPQPAAPPPGARRPDAAADLVRELAEVDAARAQLVQKRARLLMGEAKARVEAGGVPRVGVTLRQGDLLEAIAEREGKASLIVIGKRGEGADFARMHLGSNLERMVRAARRPVLVASREFAPIRRALIAFDGGPSASKAVDHISRSPLFAGLETHLVTVGPEDRAARAGLDRAAAQLAGGGLAARTHLVPGAPDAAIAGMVEDLGADLLVMGAYGHTRIRTLFIGSTTTEMIRSCRVPVLLFR
jgi:nucleotide-binding universal stress UspA family protein